MNVFEAIMTRRSTRQFKDIPVEEEKLDQVLQAGRYAPSGGNSQSVHFLVIENKEVLKTLAEMAQSEFAKMEVTEDMYRSMANSVLRSKAGGYVFHYNAPVLILTANLKSYSNNIADCSCALENMYLAANELDLGSCWINQLKWLNENEVVLPYLRSLGLEEGELVYGALALGYPDTEDGLPNRKPLERRGNKVTFVR
ncbi:MAG: nitroreductase family protein [Erysipelotrichaceae bacterium]|nr:nitroreductase family protein [Erysipelotrichaceae bacterium]